MLPRLPPNLPMNELGRIRKWHIAHRVDHPLEYQIWDAMLILWVMGRVGWLPAFALDAPWCFPLCLLSMMAPSLYVMWRGHAHATQKLRCDWLGGAR